MGDLDAMNIDIGNTGGGAGIVPSGRLIGYGGRSVMKESAEPLINDRADLFDFIKEFKAKHSLNGDGRLPIVQLMQLGGMKRSAIAAEVMAKLMENLKKTIATLSQPQLTQLHEECFSFLTVPELSTIPMLVLDRLHRVDVSTWDSIVENGLDNSPYVDLPTSLKRRIWHAIPSSFEHEINVLISSIKPYVEPIMNPTEVKPRSVERMENATLQKLKGLLGDDNDLLLVMFIDKLVDISAAEAAPGLRVAYANLLADLMCVLGRIGMPNVEKLRLMARALDMEVSEAPAALNGGQVAEIRSGLADPASCGPVALLVSSSYTRDLVMTQLVDILISARENLPKKLVPADLVARAAKLRGVPLLRDIVYIAVSCLRNRDILTENMPLTEAETGECFEKFFPFLCREAFIDDLQVRDLFFNGNARAPHEELLEAASNGPFERRVLVQYAVVLMTHGNVVPLAKMRLVLDVVIQRADVAEEAKEVYIANELIVAIMDA